MSDSLSSAPRDQRRAGPRGASVRRHRRAASGPKRRRIALFRMIVASHRPPLMPIASAADTKPRGAATSGVPGRVPHDIRLLQWLGQMPYRSQ